MEGLLFFVLITPGGMGIQFAVKSHRKKAWGALGSELDLQFVDGGFFGHPKLLGDHRGVPVVVDVEVRGSGKHKQTYTRVAADVPAVLPGGLAVSKEGVLSGIGKFFGAQDIEVGDETFDGACMIKGEVPSEVIRLFQSRKAKDAVWELVHQGTEGSLSAGRCKILVHGFSTNGSVIQTHLDTVVATALALSEAAGSPVAPGVPDDDWRAVQQELDEAPPVAEPVAEPLAEPTPEPVATPESVAPPEPAAPPRTRADDLHKLADRSLGYSDRMRLIESLQVAPLDVVLSVETTVRTTALGLDEAYRGGLTVIGRVGELSVGVRYPKDRNESLEKLAEGASLPVSATFIDFDDFYRRAILQA